MSERERFAEAVRASPVDLALACLLVGAEVGDAPVDASLAQLDALAAATRALLPEDWSPVEAAEALRRALGVQAGFAGSGADYADLRSSLLHEVLRRRRGLPLLLSVVWVEVAARAGIAAYAVGLPGHVVVGVGDPAGAHVFVDPFAGGRHLSLDNLQERVLHATGEPLHAPHLEPMPALDLLLRLLTNIRALTVRQERSLTTARTRLWAVELSLLLPRHPVDLRRERGELLARLGDFVGAAEELEHYALVVEDVDEQAAESARRAAGQARARLS